MILFSVNINFERSKLPQNCLHEIARAVAKTFDEPTENVCGNFVDKTNIMWEGNVEPAIFMVIQTVRDLDRQFNRECTQNLTDFLSKVSKIPLNRIIINLTQKVESDVVVGGIQLLYT